MSKISDFCSRLTGCLALSCALVFLHVQSAAAEDIPKAAQPQASDIQPGLGVTYYWGLNNFIYNLLQRIDNSTGTPGEPLTQLDHRAGGGPVLTSGRHDGVGAHIQGLIQFDTAGDYQFAIESNDGVRFNLNGVTLIEDPDVHPDQWSEVATATIPAPGWYPLEILYFEKKNTATLRLVWKTPQMTEDEDMVPVPESAFAHIKQ